MYKIVIPYLVFENEKIEIPVGLSELLEPAWSKNVDNKAENEIVNQYARTAFKNANGKWVTRFEKINTQ